MSPFWEREWPDFRFEHGEQPFQRTATRLERRAARKTCRMLWRSGVSSYQFGGFEGARSKEYRLIMAERFQLMHWILHAAGYSCSVADVMERCGYDARDKTTESRSEERKGTLTPLDEQAP